MNDLELYLDAAVASLRARLSASIDATNLKHADFPIPKPTDNDGNFDGTRILFGGEDETDVILSYPTVVVAAPDSDRQGFSLGQADWDVALTVVVQGFLEQTGTMNTNQRLYRGTLRYGEAILRVLTQPNAFGNDSTIARVRESYRVDPRVPNRPGRTAFTMLVFELDDVESAELL